MGREGPPARQCEGPVRIIPDANVLSGRGSQSSSLRGSGERLLPGRLWAGPSASRCEQMAANRWRPCPTLLLQQSQDPQCHFKILNTELWLALQDTLSEVADVTWPRSSQGQSARLTLRRQGQCMQQPDRRGRLALQVAHRESWLDPGNRHISLHPSSICYQQRPNRASCPEGTSTAQGLGRGSTFQKTTGTHSGIL